MTKTTGKTLKNAISKRTLLKAMFIVCMIAVFAVGTMNVAFAATTATAADGVKEIYNYIVDITKVAGALLAIFGIIQIGVSISSTHDAAQRMTGILMAAGGALLFFAEDILTLMGITVQ